jgi:hypothetical protein
LLVVYDRPLPGVYVGYEDRHEQPFAWAWLIQAPDRDVVSLSWSAAAEAQAESVESLPPGLEILRFYLRQDRSLQRFCQQRRWLWERDA